MTGMPSLYARDAGRPFGRRLAFVLTAALRERGGPDASLFVFRMDPVDARLFSPPAHPLGRRRNDVLGAEVDAGYAVHLVAVRDDIGHQRAARDLSAALHDQLGCILIGERRE